MLLLARRVRVQEGTFLQGCWLDWDVIRRDLLERAADLVSQRQTGSRAQRKTSRARPGCLPRCRCGSCPARCPTSRSRAGRRSGFRCLIAWVCLAACRGGDRTGAPRGACLERPPGNFCLGRDARASHAADDVSALHRDARRRDGREPGIAAVVLEDDPRRGRQARPSRRKRPFLRQTGARTRRPRATRSSRRQSLLDRLVPRLGLRARQAGMELVVGPVDSQVERLASTFRWSIKS